MKIYICTVCGHISFGNAPEKCPVCQAPKEKYQQNDQVFVESQKKSPEAEVKHIPSVVINKTCGLIPDMGCVDVLIRIGATLHPMEEKHFIQFIDCYLDGQFVQRVELTPNGVYPAACIHLKKKDAKKITVVENCNIHGYWMKEVSL